MPRPMTSMLCARWTPLVTTIALASACATADESVPTGAHRGDSGTAIVDAGTTVPVAADDAGTTTTSPSTVDAGTPPPSDDAASTLPPTDDAGSTTPPGPDPFAAAPTCTSGRMWLLGTTKSGEMQPGVSCDGCHKLGGSATTILFDIAGTVYPTAHEPDQCYGTSTAQVIITDAKGVDHTLGVNAAGNFWNLDYLGVGAIATPYKAKVVNGGKERPMLTPQTNGDCNACHTQDGTSAALGRIILP
ncbi:MAG: hypothetical protein ACHREM_02740 [Polyangiales bacterium]